MMNRVVFVWLIAFSLVAPCVTAQPLTSAVSDPTHFQIRLDPVGNLGGGLVPIDAAAIPGGSNLYVGTYVSNTASVRVVDPVTNTVSATPFLTFAGTGVPITGQGLQGLTFSPNFNEPTQPGYRKFYTYQAEGGQGEANTMFVHPEVANPGTVGVIREWTANAEGTAIDTSIPSRIVLNYGNPGGHMGGGMKFGPDGLLYLATGDGGGGGNGHSGNPLNNTDGFTGRNPAGSSNDVPGISNGQDFTNMIGKLIRIDPYVTNGDGSPRAAPDGATAREFQGETRYFIPSDNPFVDNPQNIYFTPIGPAEFHSPVAPLEELYAFGFRNPWKLSFDRNAVPGDGPFVADVGSRHREEILLVEPGTNHGWPYREGDITSPAANGRPLVDGHIPYLKETSPGSGVFVQFDLDPTLSDPTQTARPLALLGTRSGTGNPLRFFDRPDNDLDNDDIYGDEYGDTTSVVGGFVYRGSAIPELEGMYVFGSHQYLVLHENQNPSYRVTSIGGTLYYLDPTEDAAYKTVREFNFEPGFGVTPNGAGDMMGIAEGDDGELYTMFVNGDIVRIATVPGTTYYWDSNGVAAGLGSAASPVNWLTDSWTTSDAGTEPTGPWPNNPAANKRDAAVFTGTAGTVTVNDDVYVGELRFETHGYVINSSGGALHLTGSDPTIDVSLPANTNTATISAPIRGASGLTVTGNSLSGGLKFLVLANDDPVNPNDFAGPLTIAAGGAVRIGGGVDNEQIPDSADLHVAGVIDFVTSGGASDGKQERVRNVAVAGSDANFSVGNGADFIVNSLSIADTGSGPGVSVNGNNASVPGRLIISGWADGSGGLSLDDARLRVNTTGATGNVIGGRILLAGDIHSSGDSEVSNNNGGGNPDNNNFTHKAFDFTADAHTIDVADGTLLFTSRSAVRSLDVTSTNPGGTTLTKTGPGVWLWEHAVQSSFTGVNRVEEGTWRLGASNRLADDSELQVAGGTFDQQSFDQSVASVVLDGGEVAGTGAATLGANNFDVRSGVVSVRLAGSGSLTKTTAGTVELNGPIGYEGETVVENGVLLVNAVHDAANSYTVESAGTLGGTGVIDGPVTIHGTLAPGTSVGTLTVQDTVTFADGAIFAIDLEDNTADLLAASNLIIGNDTSVAVSLLGDVDPGDYLIAQYSGTLSGLFTDITSGFTLNYDTPGQIILSVPAMTTPGDFNNDGLVDAADYTAWRDTNGSLDGFNDWKENFGAGDSGSALSASAAVPEPASPLMFLLGAVLLGYFPRRR